MDEVKNDFGNIEIFPKNTAQLADWQFKEMVVEKINELAKVVNELAATLSDQGESDDNESEENKSDQENTGTEEKKEDESVSVEKTEEAPVEEAK